MFIRTRASAGLYCSRINPWHTFFMIFFLHYKLPFYCFHCHQRCISFSVQGLYSQKPREHPTIYNKIRIIKYKSCSRIQQVPAKYGANTVLLINARFRRFPSEHTMHTRYKYVTKRISYNTECFFINFINHQNLYLKKIRHGGRQLYYIKTHLNLWTK